MKVTIDILLLLKLYLLGSCVSLFILFSIKDFKKTKRNIIEAVFVSWVALIIPLYYLRKKILEVLYNKVDLYTYCILSSYLSFKFKKEYIFKQYFSYKWKQRNKHYADKLMKKYDFTYWDRWDNCWVSAYSYTQFRFIYLYGRKYENTK